MTGKYGAVRRDLELARQRLDDVVEVDVGLAVLLDRMIETLLQLEHKRSPAEVIAFPARRPPKLASTAD